MDRDELETMYEAAGSVAALARQLRVSPALTKKLLREAGIEVLDGRVNPNIDRAARVRKAPWAPTDPAVWQEMYDNANSVADLARTLGKSPGLIRHYLMKHGIEVRRDGFKSPRTVATPKGPDHYNWKGGITRHSDGYLLEYAPDHPAAATAKGYVLQHRLVMERHLGRYLDSSEIVHHINEDKADNRPENLEVTNRSDHMRGHKDDFPRDDLGRFTT